MDLFNVCVSAKRLFKGSRIGPIMNREEAEKVVRILLTADSGCEYCVSNLLELFCENFPQFK